MTSKKNTVPVFDMKMSAHFGISLEAEALFGIKIKDKLAWPPAQVNGDDTVPKCPNLDYVRLNAELDLNELKAYGAAPKPSAAINPAHSQIMTAARDEYVSEPELFGGDTQGAGGVRGLVSWLPGRVTQVLPSFITSRLGQTPDRCPSYRGVASIFFSGARKPKPKTDLNGIITGGGTNDSVINASNNQGFVWGTTDPYVPSASVRVMRRPVAEPLRKWARFFLNPYNVGIFPGKQWQVLMVETPLSPARKKPDGEDGEMLPQGGGFPTANPAAVIYELVSSGAYDVSAGEASIDAYSFLICARRLAFEEMGISFAWVEQETVSEVVSEICNHVGAAVFIHPRTGLYTMRLLRPDTDFYKIQSKNEIIKRPWNTRFVLDPSNADLDGDFERKTWADVINCLTIKYTNDETSEEGAITVQDQTAIAAAGGRINDSTFNGYMFRAESVAQRAAERELGNASRPLMKAAWTLNRSAWALAPFDVITVNWPSEGLEEVKFRIISVDYGTPADRTIRIEAVEDVFGKAKPRTAWVPQSPLWSPPSRPTMRQPWITPASAPMLIGNGVSIDQVQQLDADEDAVMVHMASSDGPLTGADAFVKLNGTDYSGDGVLIDSVPRATLGVRLEASATSTLDFYALDFGAQETDPEVGDVMVIVRPRPDNKTLDRYWTTISGGRLTVPISASGYGTPSFPHKLAWGVGTAAMALDDDSDRSGSLVGLAPAYHEEVCVITSVNTETGSVVIRRGCYDTVPAPIPPEAWVHHLKIRPPVPRETSPDGEIMYAVYRPKSASAVARQTTQKYLFVPSARQTMPARPGDVKIVVDSQTHAFGSKAVIEEAAPVTVQWASRNRLLDDANPALWTAGNITPEDGQSHYVRVWRRVRRDAVGDAPAVLVHQSYNLGGSALNIPAAVFSDSLADVNWNPGPVESDIDIGGAFVIEVGAMRMVSGVAVGDAGAVALMSAQAALMLVDIGTAPGGYGNRYGEDYGGS